MSRKWDGREWVVVELKSGVFWPTKETKITFKDHEFILRPETDVLAPTIAVQALAGKSYDQTVLVARRFLSALSWVSNTRVIEGTMSGGGHPVQIGKNYKGGTRNINEKFKLDYLPDTNDPDALLGLALYREAQNVNSHFYSFLGYFKILNIRHSKGSDHAAWINNTLPKLANQFEVQKRISSLNNLQGKSVGEYLWESGRCAIAHAHAQPLVDPENSEDLKRIHGDLSIIKALAEYFIEYELGIKSKHTIWKEHLYELDGFRKILGTQIVDALKNSGAVDLASLPVLPLLSVRIRDKEHFQSFEKMTTKVIRIDDGKIAMECITSNQYMVVGLVLDLKNERLYFDGYDGIIVRDNGTTEAAETSLDYIKLLRAWIGNGELEIYNSESQSLLSRCDAFLPVNIDFQGTYKNLDRIEEQINQQISLRKNLK